jgi:nucleoside-diphosphate-sugar epimerase
MRILVTGSKGFIGKETVSQCKNLGFDVLELDFPDVDIRSKDILNSIPEGLDAIIHLAALSRDPDCKNRVYECFETNVMGTINLINAAEQKKAKQFIFASSEWVYDSCSGNEIKTEESIINIANHKSEYALSKLVSEANLRQKYQYSPIPTTILRFGIIYGPRTENFSAVESLFNSVKNDVEVTVGSLKTGRHFVFVSDIVSGIIKSLGLQGFNIVNLEGDDLVTLGDVIETSKRILGKNPAINEKDPSNFNIRRISNEKAKEILGWRPEIGLEAGLKKVWKKLK